MAKPKHNLRELRQAAMAGDRSAMRALLRLYGLGEIAREIKVGKPHSNRVRNAVASLVAGTGAPGTVGEWEFLEADGTITNDLHDDPPRRVHARAPMFED
jgi:hypothetical protein